MIAATVGALALILTAYSNSLHNSFHFDDSHVVESNLYIRSIANIPSFFRDASTGTSLPANAQYRPLVPATLTIDYWLGGGLNPLQFHVTQIAMLVLLAGLVFALYAMVLRQAETGVRRFSGELGNAGWVALAAAAFYALHVTNTETLNLIHARSELMSTMGVVGTLLLYIGSPQSRRLHLYLLPMVAGALAKPPAVMAAPLLFLYVALFQERCRPVAWRQPEQWRALLTSVRSTAPAFVVGLVTFVLVDGMNGPSVNYGGGSRIEYLRTQFFAWVHYVRLFFLPTNLSADTDWRLIPSWTDPRVLLGLAFFFIALRVIWACAQYASTRPIAFGLAWFYLALLPASSVFPLAEVVNEHRVFFPYVGLTLAVFSGGALLLERARRAWPRAHAGLDRAASAGVILAIGASAFGVYERNKVWRTEETLWADVVEKSPANGRGLMNYGLTQMARGRYAEAKALFDRAQQFTPAYAVLEINLGIVTDRLGQQAEAEQHFARALQLQPQYSGAHAFYARWLGEHGRWAEAVPHLERAIALSPADMQARHLLMSAYAATGRTQALGSAARDVLALVPDDAEAKRALHVARGRTSAGAR